MGEFKVGDRVRARNGEPRGEIGWDYDPRTLKVGDVVEFMDACPTRWWFGPHTEYKTGVITKTSSHDFEGLGIEVKVNNGAIGWVEQNHIRRITPKTAPKPATGAIVALIEGEQAKPATRPVVHASEDDAVHEAERLARKNPGQVFGVYLLASKRVADTVIRTVA